MPLTELFGGAIVAEFPSHLIDASDLRQIPDTQEVWLSKLSDLSLILEVLEFVKEDEEGKDVRGGEEGVRYHFSSLAHDNSALSSSVLSVSSSSPISPSPSISGPFLLTGQQQISKFNLPSSESDTVTIRLALWRIEEKKVDLVLSVNVPNDEGEEGQETFEMAWKSLEVRDFGLFAA